MSDNIKDKHDRARDISDVIDAFDAKQKKADSADKSSSKAKADDADEDDVDRDDGSTLSRLAAVLGKISDRLDALEAPGKPKAVKSDEDRKAAKADAAERQRREDEQRKTEAEQADDEAAGIEPDDDDKTRRQKKSAALAKAQSRADSVANAHSSRAEAPMTGETIINYRRRMLSRFQHHSKDFAKIDTNDIPPGITFDAIEERVYADAIEASNTPYVAEGVIVERHSFDNTGRRITSFYGQPRTWMNDFAGSALRVVKINNGSA